MIGSDNIAVCAALHQIGLNAGLTRLAVDWLLNWFRVLGVEPDRLAAKGPGFGKNYVAFARAAPTLARTDFEGVSYIAVTKMLEGGRSELSEWAAEASFSLSDDQDDVDFVVDPSSLGLSPGRVEQDGLKFVQLLSPQYGYVFRQQKRLCPTCYAIGLGYGHVRNERHADHRTNISWWSLRYPKQVHVGLLRDVYPVNLLGEVYWKAPIDRTGATLREWIAERPADRGSIAPFSPTLLEWRPPIERIPQLREELYRAGRLFYWRFFNPKDPLYRLDPAAPWEASGETPEVYRASFYEGRQPDLIY